MTEKTLPDCPLCNSGDCISFHADRRRTYFRCVDCRFVFVPREYHLSSAAEKAEYDLHENSPADQGYRRFLSRLFEPLSARLEPRSCGLDFGSGPGPTLSVMFEEAGHSMAIYDQFYASDERPLGVEYDFVTCTEVVEHFRNPREDLDRLWSCVRPGGLLGVMTKLVIDAAAFSNWHYKNDQTHVGFFSPETFQWLAAKWSAELEFIGRDVMIFSKPRE